MDALKANAGLGEYDKVKGFLERLYERSWMKNARVGFFMENNYGGESAHTAMYSVVKEWAHYHRIHVSHLANEARRDFTPGYRMTHGKKVKMCILMKQLIGSKRLRVAADCVTLYTHPKDAIATQLKCFVEDPQRALPGQRVTTMLTGKIGSNQDDMFIALMEVVDVTNDKLEGRGIWLTG